MSSLSFNADTPVYDANGQRIGAVSLASPGDYLVIHHDGAAPDDALYVPLSAIGRSDASGIYLDLTAADLADPAWRTPPITG
jgi:hypothetical protein